VSKLVQSPSSPSFILVSLSPSTRPGNSTPLAERELDRRVTGNGGEGRTKRKTRKGERGREVESLCVVCRNKFMNCSELHESSQPIELTHAALGVSSNFFLFSKFVDHSISSKLTAAIEVQTHFGYQWEFARYKRYKMEVSCRMHSVSFKIGVLCLNFSFKNNRDVLLPYQTCSRNWIDIRYPPDDCAFALNT